MDLADDEEEDDPDAKNDPLYQVNLQVYMLYSKNSQPVASKTRGWKIRPPQNFWKGDNILIIKKKLENICF